jgi:hypothetical protein
MQFPTSAHKYRWNEMHMFLGLSTTVTLYHFHTTIKPYTTQPIQFATPTLRTERLICNIYFVYATSSFLTT